MELGDYGFNPVEGVEALWAKSGDETGWLSLPQHMWDAACVAEQVWDVWLADPVRALIAEKTGLSEREARALVAWLAGVHDVGKATTQFQCLIESSVEHAHIVEGVRAAGFPLAQSLKEKKLRHELASEVILGAWLEKRGVERKRASAIAQIPGAHHGVATDPRLLGEAKALVARHAEPWRAAHGELIRRIVEATGITREVLLRVHRLHAPIQQVLTGLVVMADWIASNSQAFPMVVSGSQEERTRRGMDAVALTAPWRPRSPGVLTTDDLVDAYYRVSFGWPEGYQARPVQQEMMRVLDEAEGPGLFIVEAPTGEGKTETALAAAQILAARTGAQGVVFAAPTMATANGIFERVLEWAQGASPTEVTSMYLGHSKSGLSEAYRNIGEDFGGEHGAVVATQWLRGNRRGVLSNFVVCTVDQVLMLALQARYSMLRHVGLACKIIVVDEVHAYDAYMSSYLGKALEWLRYYGASVILMSATLPVQQKAALVRAYGGTGELRREGEYPLLTVVDKQGVREYPVAARPTEIHAQVALLADEDLIPLLADGGCALVVCNTIRRAQETYEALNERYPGEVELHHAAFMASDRARKEGALRAALGPRARRREGRPERRIVVATQVVEQSLDIDADILITDIAPMDLLIQRVGRLHRHARPEEDRPRRWRQPQVFIRGVVEREPVPRFERGTEAIYDPALLLATMAVLERDVLSGGLRRPDDIAPLVHATYDPEAEAPEAWREAWDAARAQSAEARKRSEHRAGLYQVPGVHAAARFHSLFQRYHRGEARKGEEAGAAQVRDADPSIEVIPIMGTEYGYRPLGYEGAEIAEGATPEGPLGLRLARNTLRLPARLTRYERDFERVIDQLERETPVGWRGSHLLKGQVALVLDKNREVDLAGTLLRYSEELGLEQVRNEEA
ncbi:CRISPR-associated helicase Cas3' [Corynebacterium mastitidis]